MHVQIHIHAARARAELRPRRGSAGRGAPSGVGTWAVDVVLFVCIIFLVMFVFMDVSYVAVFRLLASV